MVKAGTVTAGDETMAKALKRQAAFDSRIADRRGRTELLNKQRRGR